MNIKPLSDHLIVEVIEPEEMKKGGIIIPDTAKEKPTQAKVIAVGTGRLLENGQRVPLEVKPGDKVLFGKYSGTEFKYDDKEYLVLQESDILAILQ